MFEKFSKIFIAILPWNVLLTVFFQFKLGIPFFGLYKEVIVIVLFITLAYEFYKRNERPVFDWLDYSIFAYCSYLTLVTLFQGLGFAHLFYGGRYDFEFLFALMIFKQGGRFLTEKLSYYIRLFLISASGALGLGLLVRFGFGEDILLHLGFSPNLSNWEFGGSIPIYHGVAGANIRRFQGIFDGPNPAAYFILVYSGLLFHYFRKKQEYAIVIGTWSIVLLGALLLTYTRSAFLALAISLLCLLVLQFRTIFRKYKGAFIAALIFLVSLSGIFYIAYERTIDRIIFRQDSSKGHFDRMVIGLKRFSEQPLGSGLATAGPAYRYILKPEDRDLYEGETKKLEDFYIPESWYVQQLVEGGIIGFLLFMSIVLQLLYRIYFLSLTFFTAFLAVLGMNVLLHTFEAIYISLILFTFLGIFLAKEKRKQVISSR